PGWVRGLAQFSRGGARCHGLGLVFRPGCAIIALDRGAVRAPSPAARTASPRSWSVPQGRCAQLDAAPGRLFNHPALAEDHPSHGEVRGRSDMAFSLPASFAYDSRHMHPEISPEGWVRVNLSAVAAIHDVMDRIEAAM